MRSFSFLSVAVTAACSLFASAVPVELGNALGNVGNLVPRGGLVNVIGNDVKPDTDIKILSSRGSLPVPPVPGSLVDVAHNDISPDTNVDVLSGRDEGLKSVPLILDDLLKDLGTVVDELNSIVTGNATKEILEPLLQQVVDIVGAAVSDLSKLVGQPIEVILKTVDGTAQIAIEDLAQLLCKVLTLVVNALAAVLKVLGGDLSIVGDVLKAVGDILGQLIQLVLKLVDGLLAVLLPLVGGLLGTITSLGFSTLGGLLGAVL